MPVGETIAEPVWNQQRLLVFHGHKAGRITLGRGVEPALVVGSREHEEGRPGDEIDGELVQDGLVLLAEAGDFLPDHLAKHFLGLDGFHTNPPWLFGAMPMVPFKRI